MQYIPRVINLTRPVAALMLSLLAAANCPAQTKPPAGAVREQQAQVSESGGVLEPDKKIERELAGGEVHVYTLSLTAGQLLHVVAEQHGVDVVLALVGPGGKPLAEVDSPNGTEGPESLLTITEAAGVYRLEVRSLEKQARAGRYTIRIVEMRGATAADKVRLADIEEAARQHQESLRLYNAAKYDEALRAGQRALSLREGALGPEHPDVARTLNNLGLFYSAKGDYAHAEAMHLRAVAIAEKALGPDDLQTSATVHNLAMLYFDKGDYARAEPLYLRALAATEKAGGPEHPDLAATLSELALLYEAKGDHARAEPLHRRALAIREKAFGPEHPVVTISLNNLASLYRVKGEFGRAEPLYLRALAINEKAFSPDHPRVAGSLNNLALLYKAMGGYDRAEPLALRALAIREKALGPEHPLVATSLSTLAALYEAKGEYERAEPMHRRALAIYEKAYGPEHPDVARTLNSLSWLHEATGDTDEAVRLQSRANDIREHNLTPILATGSEEQKLIYLRTLSGETDGTVSLHIQSALASEQAARLALTTVLRRKGRVLDAMGDSFGALRRRLSPQDGRLLEQLSAAYSQYSALADKGLGASAPAERRTAAAQIKADIEQLEALASSRSTEFRAQTQPVTLERVQEALPAGAALVELTLYRALDAKLRAGAEKRGRAHYAAYVLWREGAPAFVDLGEAEVIDRDLAKLRTALNDPQLTELKSLRRAARALDQEVMLPVRHLLGSTRRVFLSPDGALNLLPFAALVDERGKYLIEDYTVTYLTSGRDLLRPQVAAEGDAGPPLIIADPAFDSAVTTAAAPTPSDDAARGRRAADLRDAPLPPLPATRGEAERIKTLIPDARLLLGADASEAALKHAFRPRILHVATHGFFLGDEAGSPDENPLLRSGLLLAGVRKRQSGTGEDGMLTALEVAGMDLSGTKLVVLSACETGAGDVSNGEGVYGLRRALMLAGSESQVLTLWQVRDKQTRDLMTDFYKRLQLGEGRTEALRDAQLAMLRGASVLSRHPFFWAGFIQSGGWQGVRIAPPSTR